MMKRRSDRKSEDSVNQQFLFGAIARAGLCIAVAIVSFAPGTQAAAQTPSGSAPVAGFGMNVKSFGAIGDCRHDDTSALQSAINQINGRTLFMPAGCYAISQPIKVPFATGFKIVGEGREGTKIQQQTDNMPILVFTQELTHSFEVSDLMFSWAKNQSNQNTNSVGILFSTSTAGHGGLFEFTISHVTFENGFRGIYLAPGVGGSVPVWGFELEDIIAGKLMSGSTINLAPDPGVGMPRCMLRNIYSSQAVSEPQIKLCHCTSGTLDDIEDNNGIDSSLDLTSDQAMSVRSLHIEVHHMVHPNTPVVRVENSKIDFDGVSANLSSEVAGKYYLFSNVAGGGSLSLRNVILRGPAPDNGPGLHNSLNTENHLLRLNGPVKLFEIQGVDLINADLYGTDDAATSQKVSGLTKIIE